jgi:iron complex outermembrane receptor protein
MKYIFLSVFIIAHTYAYSQESILLDTIQVNAMQIPLRISETGRSITVLNSDNIKASVANSIDEILQTLTGIEVQSRGGFGVQGDILMRGSTFTQVLILVNGMKLNDPLTGHFNSYIPVVVSEIERIEVLRGGASAMYGPDATGGVINIITRTFSNADNKSGFNGEVSYGAHNLIDASTTFFHSNDKFRFNASAAIKKTDGEVIEAIKIDSSVSLEPYNAYFDIMTFSASAAFKISNLSSLKIRTSYDHRDFAARYFYTSSVFDKSEEVVSCLNNHLLYSYISDASSTEINFSHKYNTDEFIFSPDFPSTNNHTTQFYNFTINHFRPINQYFKMKAGAQLDRRSIESNDRGSYDDFHYGLYAALAYQRDGFNVILNLRSDYEKSYDFKFLPSVNISYKFSSLVFRGSVGKSIRAADYTERYVSNNLKNLTPGRNLGNPDLIPESSWSSELGMDALLIKDLQISTTFFIRNSENLIDYVLTNESEIGSISEVGSLIENENYLFAQNIAEVKTYGLEFESSYKKKMTENLLLSGSIGYSYFNTDIQEDLISVYIANTAKHLLSWKFAIDLQRFRLSMNGLFKDREARSASAINSNLLENYTLWNLKAEFSLNESIGIFLETRNVFNVAYQNILGAKMPGRWVKIGLNWDL